MTSTSEQRVVQWLTEAVVGLDLCPFAAPVLRRDAVRIVTVSGPLDDDEAVTAALVEAVDLLEAKRPGVETTLVVYDGALADLTHYLAVAATVEETLLEAGAAGALQVATFHPDYLFEGVDPDDLSHWSNRSPLPILHLLRESDVTTATEAHPDPLGIPQRNIDRLRGLGRDALRTLWDGWS